MSTYCPLYTRKNGPNNKSATNERLYEQNIQNQNHCRRLCKPMQITGPTEKRAANRWVPYFASQFNIPNEPEYEIHLFFYYSFWSSTFCNTLFVDTREKKNKHNIIPPQSGPAEWERVSENARFSIFNKTIVCAVLCSHFFSVLSNIIGKYALDSGILFSSPRCPGVCVCVCISSISLFSVFCPDFGKQNGKLLPGPWLDILEYRAPCALFLPPHNFPFLPFNSK